MKTEEKGPMLYPLPEARRRLGDISAATVYRWAAQGKIKLTRLGGRSFISAAEVARIIEEGISVDEPKAA